MSCYPRGPAIGPDLPIEKILNHHFPAPTTSTSQRTLLLALLASAHLGLWIWIDGRMQPGKHPATQAIRSDLQLIELRLPPPRKLAPAAALRVASTMTALPIPRPSALPEARPVIVEPPVVTPAPVAAAQGSLLDSEATRQAIRQAARAPLLSERAAKAMGDSAPLRPEDKLGGQIMQSASGDCLKGEFAGAGMGLLSLPFWALAEARGKCRR